MSTTGQTYSENHIIVLEKLALRALQERAIEANTTTLLASTNNKTLAIQGWTMERYTGESVRGWTQQAYDGIADYNYLYRVFIVASYNRQDGKRPGSGELPGILRKMYQKANTPAFGKWTLATVDGQEYNYLEDADDRIMNPDEIGYTTVVIPEDFEDFFSHLYGLEYHIARLRKAIEAGLMSNWMNRIHTAFIGPPGCGKSDICQSLKRALGDDAVWELDATSTTKAGAIKELAERDILPRIAVIEEIEKADKDSMGFLLSVMDMRAEIRKTTAKATVQRDTKLFVVATVNNYELFCTQQAGALASRFSNKVGFKRPSREQLAMIVAREVDKVKGSKRWINPTLDLCENHGITDPRQVIAHCLLGMDDLLTGEYQKMLDATDVDTRNEIADWSTVDASAE